VLHTPVTVNNGLSWCSAVEGQKGELIRRLFAQHSIARSPVKWVESQHFPAPSSVGLLWSYLPDGVECFWRSVAHGATPILAGTESSFRGQPCRFAHGLSFLLF